MFDLVHGMSLYLKKTRTDTPYILVNVENLVGSDALRVICERILYWLRLGHRYKLAGNLPLVRPLKLKPSDIWVTHFSLIMQHDINFQRVFLFDTYIIYRTSSISDTELESCQELAYIALERPKLITCRRTNT